MEMPKSIPEFPAKSLNSASIVKAGMFFIVWISSVASSRVTKPMPSQLGKNLCLADVA